MIFLTKTQRQAHPILSQISDDLWITVFKGQFDDSELHLTNKGFNEVTRSDLPLSDMQALIILMIAYPQTKAEHLVTFAKNTLKLGNQAICSVASSQGHLNILLCIKEQAFNEFGVMIKADDYGAFRCAAENGHLDILNWLKEQAPNEFGAMIQADDYAAFHWAASNGHLNVLNWLKEQAPNELGDMIKAANYLAFCLAAQNGHLDILKWLKQQAPNEFGAMIQADNYSAFRLAPQNGHLDTVNWLLHNPECLAYAEMHAHEYGQAIVNPFIAETLAAIHQEVEGHLARHPHTVFDIVEPERARHCFYMIRHLIRRNDRTLDDELRMLLQIPAVRALAHQEISAGNSNELLRLALSTGNGVAAEMLLTIDAVRSLAAAHDFYRAESHQGIDIRQLARDRESSMTALTAGESRRLDAAMRRYQPMIQQAGLAHIMTALRDQLSSRYAQHPAQVSINGQ